MVSNADAVRALERIADLLEIRGENAFKVRAYPTVPRGSVRAIEAAALMPVTAEG